MTEVILPRPLDTFLGATGIGLDSPLCLGESIRAMNLAFSSSAYPTANLALFIPFSVHRAIVVTKLYWYNSGTLGSNVDIGLYNEAGTRLVSSGSTAMSGTNATQIVDTTDVPLSPGQRYYFAYCQDSTTGAPFRCVPVAGVAQALGVLQQATAFPLATNANPATFAKCATAYIPQVGLATRAGF